MSTVATLSSKALGNRTFLSMLLMLIGLATVASPSPAADCTPDSITLSSQLEVDEFQATHGPCDTIAGTLTISGGDIADLSPLSGIVEAGFGSVIVIRNNPVLASLDGLSGLVSVRWIEINDNPALTSISGLSGIDFISGPLFVQRNAALTNVDGLKGVTNLFQGALILSGNPSLDDLSGLSNLSVIAASLVIDDSDALTSLDGLMGLNSVGSNISILDNDALTSISGLSGIANFSAGVNIIGNSALTNLDGFPAVEDLFSLKISNNAGLLDVDGLLGLTRIGFGGSSLLIYNNPVLVNLDGLAELTSLDADLEVIDNPQLGQCTGLAALLDAVDDALPGPGPGSAGIPDVNGEVFLSGNLAGCNSVTEVLGSRPLPPDGVTFVAGHIDFLVKGFAVTGSCLQSMLGLPGPVVAQGRDLMLKCAGQDYADNETLVYRAVDKSCRALGSESAGSIAYEAPVHAPFTLYAGSLEEVSDALFEEDETAFLALNLRTSELTRFGTLSCVTTGSSEFIFADGFE